MDKPYWKRVRITQRITEGENMHRFTLSNTKILPYKKNSKPWFHTIILVKEIQFHPWQTSNRNELILTRSWHTRMYDQRKDHIDPKRPPQSNHPKQLQTHNVSTYILTEYSHCVFPVLFIFLQTVWCHPCTCCGSSFLAI